MQLAKMPLHSTRFVGGNQTAIVLAAHGKTPASAAPRASRLTTSNGIPIASAATPVAADQPRREHRQRSTRAPDLAEPARGQLEQRVGQEEGADHIADLVIAEL